MYDIITSRDRMGVVAVVYLTSTNPQQIQPWLQEASAVGEKIKYVK